MKDLNYCSPYLYSHVDANKSRYIDALSQAVAIKSVSAWPDHREEINKMVNWTAKKLEALGAKIELCDVGKQKLPDGRVIDLPKVIFGQLGEVSIEVTYLYHRVA